MKAHIRVKLDVSYAYVMPSSRLDDSQRYFLRWELRNLIRVSNSAGSILPTGELL